MVNQNVTILDYGMCNLLNVTRAFEHVGAHVSVTDDPVTALAADRLVVPGVGAFKDSMKEVSERGFGDAISTFAETGRPMFGICVGMQMLFDGSDEFGDHGSNDAGGSYDSVAVRLRAQSRGEEGQGVIRRGR